jgi:hypothetical protein
MLIVESGDLETLLYSTVITLCKTLSKLLRDIVASRLRGTWDQHFVSTA